MSRWRTRSARRSIAIRPRPWSGITGCSPTPSRDVDALVCYAMKANSNQSVLRTLARLGAGSDVVSGGELKRALAAGFPPDKILFSGDRQDRSRAAPGAERRYSLHQRRVRARTRIALASGGRDGPHCAGFHAYQSGCRFRLACKDLDRQVREQVRRSAGSRPRRLCPRRKTAGHQGHRRRCPYRQPDHRSCSARNRVPQARRFCADAARRRPHHLPCRFRRRPRHSLSSRPGRAAGARGLCRNGQARHATISAAR